MLGSRVGSLSNRRVKLRTGVKSVRIRLVLRRRDV